MYSPTHFYISVLVLSLVTLCYTTAASADDQLKQVSFSVGHCDLYLLAQQDVQKELNLSVDEIRIIRETVVDLIEKKPQLEFKAHLELLRKYERTILSHLTSKQIRRLNQLSFQYKVTACFWDATLRQQLQITDEQFRRIKAVPYVKERGDEKVDERADETPDDLAAIRSDFFDYPKRPDKEWQMREWRRLAVLTDTQRKKWKKMLGKPYTGSIPSPVLVPVNENNKQD